MILAHVEAARNINSVVENKNQKDGWILIIFRPPFLLFVLNKHFVNNHKFLNIDLKNDQITYIMILVHRFLNNYTK